MGPERRRRRPVRQRSLRRSSPQSPRSCSLLRPPHRPNRWSCNHIYGPEALDFSPELPRIRWLPGGREHLLAEEDRQNTGWTWHRVDAASGDTRPFFDPAALAEALAEQLRMEPETAAALARPGSLHLSPGADRLLLEFHEDLFVWDLRAQVLTRLTRRFGREELAHFSLDGQSVAFVRDADLHVVDLEGRRTEADHGRRREHAERQAGLGLPGGDLRPRQLQGTLVEPRQPKHRLPADRPARRAALHGRGPPALATRAGGVPLPQGRGPEPPCPPRHRVRRRRRRRCLGRPGHLRQRGDPVRERRVRTRRRHLVPGAGPSPDLP